MGNLKRWLAAIGLLAAVLATTGAGCSRRIEGSHGWWDDRTGKELPDDYQLPPEESIGDNDSWSKLME